MGIPLSPTRLRRRSFLNDPPGLPGHSILLNCPTREQGRDPSPNPSSSSSQGHSHAEADAIAAKAASGSVSFAPLPVIPPELKRRSSITLGVAARKNLLSSPEDEIYPDPKKKREAEEAAAAAAAASGGPPPPGAGGRPGGRNTGAVRSVYMSDEDWEAYKRRYETKNGNDVVDIGELVTTQAKNLWRKVQPGKKPDGTPGTPGSAGAGTAASPSSSTTGSMLSSITSPKLGSSPNGGILGSFTSPRLSIRRRSDPGTSSAASTKEAGTTKSPELPKVEEESLSRRESAESKIVEHPPGSPPPTSPTSPKYMDWDKKKTSRSASMDSMEHGPTLEVADTPPSITSPRGPPSPPPRVQDVLPSEDELRENRQEKDKAATGHETESEGDDDFKDAEDGHADGTLGLERVEIRSEAGDYGQQAPEQRYTRDSAVLGFDRSRFHEE